jgi:phospholipase C
MARIAFKACMTIHRVTRRELLKLSGIAAAAELASLALYGCGGASVGTSTGSPNSPACAKLSDIDHVVILIQENRSFDHYFGSYRGVRVFPIKVPHSNNLTLPIPQPSHSRNCCHSIWKQRCSPKP